MTQFSIDSFATTCKAAMNAADDRQAAAARCLEEAIAEHGAEAIVEALQAAIPPGANVGEMIVHQSDELTMLFARIPPRFQSGIHDHTVFACIGQLEGEEENTIYEETEDGLREVTRRTASPGQVLQLPPDVIHGIANPGDAPAHALHLYGGNFAELHEHRKVWDANSHAPQTFSFPALVQQSIATMKKSGNQAGLKAVVEAIPALRDAVQL